MLLKRFIGCCTNPAALRNINHDIFRTLHLIFGVVFFWVLTQALSQVDVMTRLITFALKLFNNLFNVVTLETNVVQANITLGEFFTRRRAIFEI